MSGDCDFMFQTKPIVKRYVIQWKIENVSHIPFNYEKKLESPDFITGTKQTKWALSLSKHKHYNSYVSVFLELKSNVEVSVKYEISYNKSCSPTKGNAYFKAPGSFGFPGFGGIPIDSYSLKNDTLIIDFTMDVVEDIVNSTTPKVESDLNHISEDYVNLLNSSVMSDFVIAVGKRHFNVHKQILSARSPVFAAIIKHGFKETKTNTLLLNDVSPHVMESVIKYIYSGKFDGLEKKAKEILPVADKYGLGHLKAMCEEVLCSQLTLDNVVFILCLADMHSAQKVKEKAIILICDNYLHIFKTSEWKSMVSQKEALAVEIRNTLFDGSVLGKSISLLGIS